MQSSRSNMQRLLLKDARGKSRGWARLEEAGSTLQITLQTEVQAEGAPLRLLLVSAGDEAAVLDLGPVDPAAGSSTVRRSASLRLWDALALAEDWPSGRLVAAGWLKEASGSMWRLAEAAAQFLLLPPAQSS